MSVVTLSSSDFDEWSYVWRQYLAFYNTELPESQYQDTFSRIIQPDGNLEAFILKDDDGKIVGLSHYLYHQSSWTSSSVCYLNGQSDTEAARTEDMQLTRTRRSLCRAFSSR
jgi:hypothetical protein